MEKFYNNMTYFAVYDGHGNCGRFASELARDSIKRYLEDNKVALDRIVEDEEIIAFFKRMFAHVQNQFKEDVRKLEENILEQ